MAPPAFRSVGKDREAAQRWRLTNSENDFLAERYLIPEPRLAIAPVLREFASAAMDVSDGLAGDLAKLARVSGVAVSVAVEKVPLSSAARAVLAAEPERIETILTGGDDFEILASVSAAKLAAFRTAASAVGVNLTEIGEITASDGAPRFVGRDGLPLKFARPSFSHF